MTRRKFNHPINPHHFHHIQTPRILPISNLYDPSQSQSQSQSHPSNLHINPPHHHQPLASDYETRLRDEVIYLHSLWHSGPPSQTPFFLRPSTPTHFKKSHKTPKILYPHLISDKEWPVQSKPTSTLPSGSSWPEFKPVSAPVSRPATAEERDRVLGVKIHLKGLDLCSGLVRGAEAGDGDEDDDEDEDEDEVCDDAEEYEFLMKVFEENGELREFYEKNCEGGEFYCLICGVLGNKLSKKYKNCVSLIQHCVTISKTKKKAAHRALGHVICKVLGWDVNRLPSLPSSTVGVAAGQSLGNSSEAQRESKNKDDGQAADDNANLKLDEIYQDSENVQLENKNLCGPSGESIDCQSLLAGDAAK